TSSAVAPDRSSLPTLGAPDELYALTSHERCGTLPVLPRVREPPGVPALPVLVFLAGRPRSWRIAYTSATAAPAATSPPTGSISRPPPRTGRRPRSGGPASRAGRTGRRPRRRWRAPWAATGRPTRSARH